jgi:ABC-type nitrate/sulfonate/bicarbonate transport system permease component
MTEEKAGCLVLGFIFGLLIGLIFGIGACQTIWVKDSLDHKVGAYNGTTGKFELFYYPTNQ